jgi:2,5-diketo-D-gluconate reductase A
MIKSPLLHLNDGRQLPQLGLGTYMIDDGEVAAVIRTAVDIGYRLVDTAAIYRNEQGVGKGLGDAQHIFLTTKIWNDDQGFDSSRKAFERSLDRLGRDEVDLLLIHWPCADRGLFVDTWKAFIELRDEGKARSIGVSNFQPRQLEQLANETGVIPALNQIELHPAFQQRDLRSFHADLGIVTQSWSPLGRGNGMGLDVIRAIADELDQSPASVIIRWHIQHGLAVIPKASSRGHIADNFTAVSFELSDEQMSRIDALDDGDGRIGPDPAIFC